MLTGLTDRVADAVTLAASELVANVVQHTPAKTGTLQVWARRSQSLLRLEVKDSNPTVPQMSAPTRDEGTGRGLRLVAGLAESWGVEPSPADGKIVWAE